MADRRPDDTTLVVFTVGASVFGVDAHRVREVLWLPELAAVQEAPHAVVGVVSLRGAAVPVLDLRSRFGHPRVGYDVSAKVIVLDTATGLLGVLADEVSDITVTTPVPDAHEVARDAVVAEAQAGDALVMVLSADAVWPREPGPPANPDDERDWFPDAEAWPELRERARTYAAADQELESGSALELVVVELDGERFGLSLGSVREFATITDLARIPCCPPHVLGSMNLRGELVTVMDIRPALGLPAQDPHTLLDLVVCDVDDQMLGIAVAVVVDVATLLEASVFPPPASTTGVAERFVRGEAMIDGRMITLIDLPALLVEGGLDVNEVV